MEMLAVFRPEPTDSAQEATETMRSHKCLMKLRALLVSWEIFYSNETIGHNMNTEWLQISSRLAYVDTVYCFTAIRIQYFHQVVQSSV